MSRIGNGLIQVNKTSTPTSDLLSIGVIRGKSGPKGFKEIDSRNLLELFYKDSINIDSYRMLVDNGVKLGLSLPQFNRPTQVTVLTTNSNIPINHYMSDWDLSLTEDNQVDISTPDLGKLIEDNRLTYSYRLTEFREGQYIGLPIGLNRWGLYYVGSKDVTIPIELDHFDHIVRIDSKRGQGNYLNELKNALDSTKVEGVRVFYSRLESDELVFHSTKPHKYDVFDGVDGNIHPDKVEDEYLLACNNSSNFGLAFYSDIYGPRINELEFYFDDISFSEDTILTIKLDEYSESWRVSLKMGSNYYIKDILQNSNILKCFDVINPEVILNELYTFSLREDPIDYDINSMKNAWDISSITNIEAEDIPEDSIYYLAMDDGLSSIDYVSYLIRSLSSRYYTKDIHVVALLKDYVSYQNPRLLAWNQWLENDKFTLLPWVYPIIWMYNNQFVGDFSDYIIKGVCKDPKRFNSINKDQYLNYSDTLISTDGNTCIVPLIVSAFTQRLQNYLIGLLGEDKGYEAKINAYLTACLTLSPMIKSAKLNSTSKVGNQLTLKVTIELKSYTTDKLIINFIVNI